MYLKRSFLWFYEATTSGRSMQEETIFSSGGSSVFCHSFRPLNFSTLFVFAIYFFFMTTFLLYPPSIPSAGSCLYFTTYSSPSITQSVSKRCISYPLLSLHSFPSSVSHMRDPLPFSLHLLKSLSSLPLYYLSHTSPYS